MIKIDLDRLHKKPKVGRRSGRTFDMIVEVLQNIDLSEKDFRAVIGIPYSNRMFYLRKMIREVAPNFDLEIDKEASSEYEVHFKDKGMIMFATPGKHLRGMTYTLFDEI